MSRLTVAWIALTFVVACGSNPGATPDASGAKQPVCGDGICDVSEIHTCPADCGMGSGSGSSAAVCGNGICETGENETNCPSDCTISMCGNGICETGENSTNCPQDCGSGSGTQTFDCTDAITQDDCLECFEDDAELGIGTCDEFGDALPGTAADCAMCVANGNFGTACVSQCTGGETQACAQCETIQSECGDGFCEVEDGENETNCPVDCPMVPCGDGICDVPDGETSVTCPADCLLTDSFDCSDQTNQGNCSDCFFDDSTAEGGMLGECTTNDDVPGGSATDCAKCASIGAFGPDCEPFCNAGETNTCATCVSQGL
jgi:hypothetical protein